MSVTTVEPSAAPPKSKKLLLIVGAVVLILALAAAGAWFYVSKQRAALDADADEEGVVATVEQKDPPTYLPLDNMVVNLSDPGGEKVAQIGITLELSDSKATEKVKQYLPTIRSSVLLLVSQRSSEDLLRREGKEKLAADILQEAGRPFGRGPATEAAKQATGAKGTKPVKNEDARDDRPVRRVLFSSFIVQ